MREKAQLCGKTVRLDENLFEHFENLSVLMRETLSVDEELVRTGSGCVPIINKTQPFTGSFDLVHQMFVIQNY